MTSELTAEGPPPVQGQRQADPDPRRRLGLRHAAAARVDASGCEAELRYVREMGLNTIRLEGKLESDEFYDLADRVRASCVMPGWCCCDQWELWDKWDAEDHRVGARVAARPDPAPAQPPERARLAERQRLPAAREGRAGLPRRARGAATGRSRCSRTRPTRRARSAARAASRCAAPTTTCRPSYWLTDTKNGGAFGFATEIGPGRGGAADREPEADAARRTTSGRSTSSGRSTPAATSSRTSSSSPTRSKAATARPPASRTTRARRRRSPTTASARCSRRYGRNKYTVDRRHPVDAQQRLAVDDLAPLRLLPAARRRLLRHEEGLRAAARPVLVRRPLGRGRQRPAASRPRASRSRPSVFDLDLDAEVLAARPRRRGRRRRGARASPSRSRRDLATTYFLRLALDDAAGQLRQPQLLLALDARGRARLEEDRSGSTRRRSGTPT